MKSLLTIVALISTLYSSGQSLTEIRSLLKEKNYIPFKTCIDKATGDHSVNGEYVKANWQHLRDITPEYQEGYIFVTDKGTEQSNGDIDKASFYTIWFIATEKEIIWYRVSQRKSIKKNGEQLEIYPLVDSFRNESQFFKFKESFLQTYNAKLNTNELLTSYDYGVVCDDAAEPRRRTLLKSFVKTDNVGALNEWLTSPNCELQAYAVDGFYQLKITGYKLTVEQKKVIEIVKNKRGTIHVCEGDVHSTKSIKEVLAEFKF